MLIIIKKKLQPNIRTCLEKHLIHQILKVIFVFKHFRVLIKSKELYIGISKQNLSSYARSIICYMKVLMHKVRKPTKERLNKMLKEHFHS